MCKNISYNQLLIGLTIIYKQNVIADIATVTLANFYKLYFTGFLIISHSICLCRIYSANSRIRKSERSRLIENI